MLANRATLKYFAVPSLVAAIAFFCPAALADDDTQDPSKVEAVAKVAISAVLSFILEAPCTVDGVHWEKGGQYLELTNLRIGNPIGFKTEYALAASKVRVEGDPTRLLAVNPELRLIQLTGTSINVETSLGAGSNLKRLKESANRPKFAATGHPLPSGASKKFRIDRGVMDGADITVTTRVLGKSVVQSKTVGPIDMSFTAVDGGGVAPDQAVSQFLARLIEAFEVPDEQAAPATATTETKDRPLKRLLRR